MMSCLRMAFVLIVPVMAGHDTLRFEYRRPWEKETAPVQTILYKITVK
jgi:hypothetical protein